VSGLWQQQYLEMLHITSADTVVDVGCGDGLLSEWAARTGAAVIGIDIDPEIVARADKRLRELPGCSFLGIHSNCDPIPLAEDSASVVVCSEVLEHVPTAERLLGELVRIGKPRARYLLSVPDPVSETIMRIVAPPWYARDVHPRIFHREQITALATAAGLEITQHHYSGFASAIWWIMRMMIGMKDPCVPHPTGPSLLSDWDAMVQKLASMPGGLEVLHALSQHVPKSHVLLGQKAIPVLPPEPGSLQWFGKKGKTILKRLTRWRIGNFEIGVRRLAS
jgi:ubiquinone/menaquinone biosynthesis C-methylase UbiE